jgi:CRP/FNR family transcriptional regulator, cyclic AMP receptor protein
LKHEQIIKLLQNIPIFKGLSDSELEQVANLSITRHYKPGTHVFMQGEEMANVYFILEGKVKIYKTNINGKEQIVNMLKPSEMFPHQAFFRKGHYPAHAEVVEDTTLTIIPLQSFEQFLILNPEISVKVFRVLGDLIVELQKRLEEKIFHNTYEQVVLLLLRLGKKHGNPIKDGVLQFDTPFTNQELANMIGSTRESINRSLSKLKKKKLLDITEDHFIQINVNGLRDELF